MVNFDLLYSQAPEYFNFMKDTFSLCKDKTVLELGAFEGRLSNLILQNNPTSLTVVEPNNENPGYNTELKDLVDFHNCTLNDYYSYTKKKVDVVVACGLFYHLHSPLHALELILNHSDPDIIIMDSPEAGSRAIEIPYEISYGNEVFNKPGMAFSDKNITKPIKLRAINPYATVKNILQDLFGFTEEQYVLPDLLIENLNTARSKQSTIVSVFKK